MRDPVLDEARARQRRTLRAMHDPLLVDWRPPPGEPLPIPAADRPFLEMALRQAADELAPGLDAFFSALLDLAYAERATAAITLQKAPLGFGDLLASLERKRVDALDRLQRVRIVEDFKRWVHLVVWADRLADDGYRDPRFS